MTVYQLVINHYDNDLGGFCTPGRIYLHKEDAEAAKEWYNSLPEDPYDFNPGKASVDEVEIQDTFVPWISAAQVAAKQEEIDNFYKSLACEYYCPDIPSDDDEC